MKISKAGWWAIGLGVLFIVGVFGAVLNDADPVTSPAGAPRILASETIPGTTFPVHTLVVEAGVGAGDLTAKARDLCGAAQFCDVRAWTDPASVGRGWPLTEREIAAVKYSYAINRATGAETEIWDCAAFPSAPADRCSTPAGQ